MNAETKITKAKVELVIREPFFGVLISRLYLIQNNSIPTAATDGRKIYYNESFIDNLSLDETIGLLAHEVLHVVMLHMIRRNDRDFRKWNIACDFAINQLLSNFQLPQGVCLDPQYQDMSAEEIYNILPEGIEKQYTISFGDVMDSIDGSNLSDEEKEKLKEEIRQAVVEAGTVAKMQGKLSQGLERLVGEFIESKVDWKEALHSFVSEHTKDDYSFRKPNIRYSSSGFYLPSLYSERMKPILLGIDTSGSITEEMLRVFGGHMQAIQEQHNVDIQVLYIDSAINKERYFESDEQIELECIGGGGTSFIPLFDWYKEQEELEFSQIVYLTDLEGEFPNEIPDIPVLWVTDNQRKEVPFGTKVIFE